MNTNKRTLLNNITGILIITALFIFFSAAGIGCPIKFLTGISCGGCGMTRAWYSVLHLEFSEAFGYHPLFWTVPLAAVIYFFKEHIDRRIFNAIVIILIILFVVVYLYRMFNPEDNIVVSCPEDSLIINIIQVIFRGL